MKIKKSDLTGLREVYGFTLSRFFKSRSAVVSMVILFLFALLSQPIMALVGGASFGGGPEAPLPENEITPNASVIENVYVKDESGFGISTEKLDGEYWAHTEVSAAEGNALTEYDVLVELSPGQIAVTPSENTEIMPNELENLAAEFEARYCTAAYAAAGVAPEQLALLGSGYSVNCLNEGDLAPAETETVSFGVQYGYSFVILMLCTYSATYIIQSVLEEKASKLVELLMISVKPLALIGGKILAVMTFMFAQVIGLLCCMGISGFITEMLFGAESTAGVLAGLDLEMLIGGIGFGEAVIILLFLALGYLTVSVISGISGACCSNIEEAGGAATASMLLVLSGYMASMFVSNIPSEALSIAASLFPVISIFCAPTQYMAGNIDLWVVIGALLIQTGVVLALFAFCARVYSALITHSGSKIKFKELLAIAKANPKGGEANG